MKDGLRLYAHWENINTVLTVVSRNQQSMDEKNCVLYL